MQPQTHPKIIFLVIGSIALLSLICVSTLSYCLIEHKEYDQTLLTAFVGISTGLLGALSGLLVNTRTAPPSNATSSITEEQKTVSTIVSKPADVVAVQPTIPIAPQVVDKPIVPDPEPPKA